MKFLIIRILSYIYRNLQNHPIFSINHIFRFIVTESNARHFNYYNFPSCNDLLSRIFWYLSFLHFRGCEKQYFVTSSLSSACVKNSFSFMLHTYIMYCVIYERKRRMLLSNFSSVIKWKFLWKINMVNYNFHLHRLLAILPYLKDIHAFHISCLLKIA